MEPFRDRLARLSQPRLTLLAMELQERVAELEAAAHEPVAVIAMACHFPGDAQTPADFWRNLSGQRDCVDTISAARWRLAGTKAPHVLGSSANWGAQLSSVEMFDPSFFHISPGEAAAMDPQQRLLLEVCWEAIENAGIPADSLAGSETGAFIGMSSSDYAMLAHSQPGNARNKYIVTGAANSIAVGRLSYMLGLQGPNMAVDTSCSSSATAIHLAVQSLRRGECSLAFAGGVHLALIPKTNETLSRFNLLAADGRCKAFADAADGIGRGEGCGVLLLKRLRDAQRDHDNILGVIRGSACNQDGRTSGLTAPNGPAQERVIRAALKDAGVNAHQLDYVEAHGTGTVLGDPIEVSALARVFSRDTSQNPRVTIGSVKSNIGHLEAAAGVAGIIKVLLAFEHEEIPASLHCATLNKRVPWGELPLAVAQEPVPWLRNSRSRLAGVSSFGYSGTNVHIVLEEPPSKHAPVESNDSLQIITASARSLPALKQLCQRYAKYLKEQPSVSIVDFARSVNEGRSHLPHRFSCVVGSVEEARGAYARFASQAMDEAAPCRFVAKHSAAPRRTNDRHELLEQSASFRQAFTQYQAAIQHGVQQASSSPQQIDKAHAFSADRFADNFVLLHPGTEPWMQILQGLSAQYLVGADVDWKALPGWHPLPKLVLPNYPFERQRYWLDLPDATTANVIDPAPEGPSTTRPDDAHASWLYEIAWELVETPAADPDTSLSAVPAAAVDRIMASMAPLLEEASSRVDCSFLPQFRRDTDALSVQFILQALEQNHLSLQLGREIPLDVVSLLGTSRRYERLLERMFAILEEEGILRKSASHAASHWVIERLHHRFGTAQEIRRMRTAYPLAEAHLNIFERASLLGDVLQGRMSGLEMLFPQGSMVLAEALYQNTVHARVMNSIIAQLALRAVEVLPPNRTLRILELGAGTGSTTGFVIPLLPANRIQYFFTDVSRHFLAAATKKFSQHSFMRYGVLDIEASSVLDGEEPRSFDLIIAANVLHATKSLRKTLANVRNLLAPGGFLLLLEASHTERLADITLGTIDGWWRFEDTDLRQRSALISPSLWQQLLAECGFTSALLPSSPDLFGVTRDEPAIIARLDEDTAVAAKNSIDAEHRVLLVSALHDSSEALASHLRRRGAYVVRAVPGSHYEILSDEVFSLKLDDPSQCSRLFEKPILRSGELSVVYLPELASSVNGPADAARKIASETLTLLQQTLSQGGSNKSLWLIAGTTQHALSTGGMLAESVLPGLVRVVASEYPGWSCHSISADLQAAGSAASVAERIMFQRAGGEPELSLRDGQWLTPRLRPLALPGSASAAETHSPEAGAWLITGGFGVLGLLVAKWLARQGAGDLFLFGRNPPSEAALITIEEMRRTGSRVHLVLGDVALEADVLRLFEQLTLSGKPLRGIFHTAAVLEDASVVQLTRESLQRVLAPKITGSWLLHKHSSQLNLQHFTLFSSAASVLGTPGQANYAMANTFMDALAHYRRANGLPGISIDWGPWNSSGADVKPDFLASWQARGGHVMTDAQGLDLLDRIMSSPSAQVAVLPMDWRTFSAGSRKPPAILQGLVTPAQPHPDAPSTPFPSLKQQLEEAPLSERAALVASYVEMRLTQLLGMSQEASIPPDIPFLNLGLDSLMSLELKNELQNALGMDLSPSLLYDHASLRALNAYLAANLSVNDVQHQGDSVEEGYDLFRL